MSQQLESTTAPHRRQPYRTKPQNRFPSSKIDISAPSTRSDNKTGIDQSPYLPNTDTEPDVHLILSSLPSKTRNPSAGNMQAPAPLSLRLSRDYGHRFGKSAANEIEAVAESAESVAGKTTKASETNSWRARSTANRPIPKQAPNPATEESSTTLPNHALQPAQKQHVAPSAVVKQSNISPTKTRTSSTTSEPTPRPTPSQSIANSAPIHPRRASVPIALASYPHASVPSIPYTQVPDLNRIRPIAPLRVAEQLLLSEPCQLPRTREFSLAPLPYTDADIPRPEPYNEAYPHPLTSYASPGVNPNAVISSGYDVELAKLMETDRSKALGTILATCDRPGITAPTLAKHLRSYIPDGNGIPGFDNEGAARAVLGSVGAAMCRSDERLSELTGSGASGIQPVFTPALSHVPPRLAAQARSDNRMRDAKPMSISVPISAPLAGRNTGYGYEPVTPPTSPYDRRSSANSQYSDYFSVPPHLAATRRVSVVSAGTDSDGQYSTMDPYDRGHPTLLTPAPTIYPFSQSQQPSPWYKTELCPAYQETGQCRYGEGCQFAHGLQELRLPMGRVPFPEIVDELPTVDQNRVNPVPKIDIRRASAPHSQLPTVEEVDDDHYYHLHGGRRSSEATEVPPIGFERLIRFDSIARLTMPRPATQSGSNRELSSSMSSDMPWTPNQSLGYSPSSPSRLAPQPQSYDTHPSLHARASQSSLSQTSSGAGYSPKRYGATAPGSNDKHNDINDIPTHILDIPNSTYGFPNTNTPQGRQHLSSPSSNDAGSSASWASRSPSDSAGGQGQAVQPSTSASVEFSTGRSIWC